MEGVKLMIQEVLRRMEALDSRLSVIEALQGTKKYGGREEVKETSDEWEDSMAQLNMLKEGGNFFDYANAFVELASKVEVSDEALVAKFMEGLENQNHKLIAILKPRTLQQAISYGRALTLDVDPNAIDLVETSVVAEVRKPNVMLGREDIVCTALADDTCDEPRIRMNKVVRSNSRVRPRNGVYVQQYQDVKHRKGMHILPADDTREGITGNLFDAYLKPYFLEATDILLKEMHSKGLMDEAVEGQRIKANKGIQEDEFACNSIASGLRNMGQREEAMQLLFSMKKRRIPYQLLTLMDGLKAFDRINVLMTPDQIGDLKLQVKVVKIVSEFSINIWLKFLPPERVLPFGCKDNYGKMGDNGPCGPCTETHYDRIGNHNASSLVNNDDPTCIKIWNLVFIRFKREIHGSLKPLSAKHIDTGMGFERLTSTLRNKMSNYDTDVFMPIFDVIQQITRARPYTEKVGKDDKVDMAYRGVADHSRTLTFAMADGSCPGNKHREYVRRRIIRRAVRYESEVLKTLEVSFNRLVSIVVRAMGDVFPELRQLEVCIREIIAKGDSSFGKTLQKGIENFKKVARDVEGKTLSGHDASILWNTHEFSLDLNKLMAKERELVVDINGFNSTIEETREKSRSAQSKQAGGIIIRDADATSSFHKKGAAPTDDSFKLIGFKDPKSVIKAISSGSEFLEDGGNNNEFGMIWESTLSYAEQGGQIYDIGLLEGPFNTFEVDYERWKLIVPNHPKTHMLKFGLREVLGNHVVRKGSNIVPEKSRFYFSHNKPMDSAASTATRKASSRTNMAVEGNVLLQRIKSGKGRNKMKERGMGNQHLFRPLHRMIQLTKNNRFEQHLQIADWVLVKFQLYGFELPKEVQVHLIFYISQLKKSSDTREVTATPRPNRGSMKDISEYILSIIMTKTGKWAVTKYWFNSMGCDPMKLHGSSYGVYKHSSRGTLGDKGTAVGEVLMREIDGAKSKVESETNWERIGSGSGFNNWLQQTPTNKHKQYGQLKVDLKGDRQSSVITRQQG